MNWFGVKAFFVYDTMDEPIAEFVDPGFLADWRGFEESVFIVQAESFDDAGARITAASGLERFVNIYGQTVEKRLEAIVDLYSIPEWEFSLSEGSEVVEVYSNIVDETTSCAPEGFIKTRFTYCEGAHDMLRDISLYENRARYEELRGQLPEFDTN
jgi:hypothetical protein